ncbi:cytochrome P450 [Xylariaceae sp. FL0662B]|nr:cytochrome P450 [Xylariaceae sp. FL0662B]
MRYGPNRLVYNSVAAFRDIYQNERLVKSHVYRATQQQPKTFNIFNVTDKAIHRSKRRLIGQVVSEQSMRSFEPIMQKEIDVFIGELFKSSQTSEPMNMTPMCRYLGLDIVGHLGFGFDLHLQTSDTYRFLSNAFNMGNYRINVIMQLPWLLNLRPDLIAQYVPNSPRPKLLNMLEKMITQRLSKPIDAHPDLMSHAAIPLNANPKDFSGLRQGDLWPEAAFFFSAAGETTATALAAVFFYLSHFQDAYQKLTAEIRSTFKSGNEIRGGPQLASCRYLRACIDEALRMSPSVVGTLWREVGDDNMDESLIIDGHIIPANTMVGVHVYSPHHNEQYFPDPFNYRPDRWLEEEQTPEQAAATKVMQNAFAAFSLGYRGCAGKPMAYLETSLTIAKSIWYFDFYKAPGDLGRVGEGVQGLSGGRARVNEFQMQDIFAAMHDGTYLMFKPR